MFGRFFSPFESSGNPSKCTPSVHISCALKRQKPTEPQRQKTYLLTCAASEDSDQPAHSHICAVWSESSLDAFLDSQRYKVSSCGQRRLWSDCADAQADLSLRWAHMSEDTFSHFFGSFTDENVQSSEHNDKHNGHTTLKQRLIKVDVTSDKIVSF